MNSQEAKTEGQEVTPEDHPKQKKLRLIKKMKVNVEQEEIDKAKRGDSKRCMIVRSIQRDYPTLKNIHVEKELVRFTDPDRNVIYTFDMVPVGKGAILVWDEGTNIQPFSFTLRHAVVRRRVKRKDGSMKPKANEDRVTRSLGVVPRPKTKEGAIMRGRDRVFGAKLWTKELATLRSIVAGEPQFACPE
jgi:hypothetical protein